MFISLDYKSFEQKYRPPPPPKVKTSPYAYEWEKWEKNRRPGNEANNWPNPAALYECLYKTTIDS